MKIFISIDGVLRNKIEKFKYHYVREFLDSDTEFNYEIIDEDKIQNDDLLKYFKFENKEEFNYFLYNEFGVEIYGFSSISYQNCFKELHELISKYKEHEISVIGLNEFGKTKMGTLFFLSKCGYMGDKIEFITADKIKETWDKCDIWLTDDKNIVDNCPENKKVIKFNTVHNTYFTSDNQITKINELENYV